MRKERIGKIGYRICAVLAAAVSLWCMGDNLWPVVKENGAAGRRLEYNHGVPKENTMRDPGRKKCPEFGKHLY